MRTGRYIVTIIALAASSALAQDGVPEPLGRTGPWPGWEPSPRTQVVLLGTGTPIPDPERSGPAVAIIVDGIAYLVDAGPGIVRRAALASRELQHGALFPEVLDRAFITHLHSDHTLGLPDLIFSPWVVGRRTPLALYGPSGIEAMATHLLAAWEQDIEIRTRGLEDGTPNGYHVDVHEIEAGIVLENDSVTIEAIPVDHGTWTNAFGYKFTTPDRVIVISGDAALSDTILEAARGADMLIHEVYANAPFQRGPASWRAYHSTFHTSTLELGALATDAEPGLLVLYHQLFFGASEDDIITEIRTVYDGPLVSGRDLDLF
jgi:ribonuclease BN (tRNA processing enzyme)